MKKLVVLALALVAMASAKDIKVTNINTAPADTLAAHLPGVGAAVAERIIEERKAGKFTDCADIQARVKGIGDKKIAKLCPSVEF